MKQQVGHALGKMMRQLIVSFVETGIETVLAARAAYLAGNDAAVAARDPSPTKVTPCRPLL
jgi:hypothetical protein